MSIKVKPDKYPEIIKLYNTEGKTAVYDLVRSHYGIKNPTSLMKRLKTDASLGYNPETDQFESVENKEEDIFLNLDELCEKRTEITADKLGPHIANDDRAKAMEHMVHALISDRLLELSRYVFLDTISRRILIDKSGMQTDGYEVIVH